MTGITASNKFSPLIKEAEEIVSEDKRREFLQAEEARLAAELKAKQEEEAKAKAEAEAKAKAEAENAKLAKSKEDEEKKKQAQALADEEARKKAKAKEEEALRKAEEAKKLKADAELEAKKKKEEEFNQKELERLREIEFEKIDTQMTLALEKSDLPKKPYVVRKMAEYMLIGANNGINLSPEDVLPIVREELLTDLQEIINTLPEDKAEEFIGKEVLNRFRKKNLAKAEQTPASVKSSIKDVGIKKTEDKQAEPVNYKKFFGF